MAPASFITYCPDCGSKMTAPMAYLDKDVTCTNCGGKFRAAMKINRPVYHRSVPAPVQKLPGQVKKCENCEREIGKLEKGYEFQGNFVCSKCDSILRDDNDLPSRKQLRFAERLGIVVPPGISRGDISDLIDEKLQNQRDEDYNDEIGQVDPVEVQTIEKTSKRWKKMQLIGVGLCVLGIAAFVTSSSLEESSAPEVGSLMLVIGIIVFIYGRIAAWWHHG